MKDSLQRVFVFALFIIVPGFAGGANYPSNWSGTSLSNTLTGQTATYTLSAINPNNALAGCVNSCIPAGATVTVIFPPGTNAVTANAASSTFYGSSIAAWTTLKADTLRFAAPVQVPKNTFFTVVIAGVTNPPVSSATWYTGLRMTAVNASGATQMNTFQNSSYYVYPLDYSANWTSAALSKNIISQVCNYTLNARNPNSGGGGCVNSCIPAGAAVTINFPPGTNASTATAAGSTFAGTAIASFTAQTATTLSFAAPVSVAYNAVFSVVIRNVTNPGTSATYTALTMTASNAAGGTNTFSNASYTLYAAPAGTVFQAAFGGSGSEDMRGVVQTADGGYAIAGSTNTAGFVVGAGDFYLVKVDATGNLGWSKSYGSSSATYSEGAQSLKRTSDGGFILIGMVGNVPPYNTYLVKTNSAGDTLWTRAYTVSYGSYSVEQTSDGGYILCGSQMGGGASYSVASLVKLDVSGNVQWTRGYGNGVTFGESEGALVTRQTADGGYVLIGTTSNYSASPTMSDYYLIRTDNTGNLLWTRVYSASAFNDATPYHVLQTDDDADGQQDDGFLLSGYYGFAPYPELCLIKVTATGTVQWYNKYSGPFGAGYCYWDGAWQTGDGNFVVTGISSGGMMKVNGSNGNVIWAKAYQGAGGITVLQQTTDGGMVMVSTTSLGGLGGGDGYIVKTDDLGRSGCYETDVTSQAITVSYSPTVGSGGVQFNGISTPVSYPAIVVNTPPTAFVSLCQSSAALPVTLLAFTAEVTTRRAVMVKWTTASASYGDYFTVERGRDGKEWETLGRIMAGDHSSAIQSYDFTDEHPYTGVSYYRLRQSDYDGLSAYYGPKQVCISHTSVFEVFPNPAAWTISISSENRDNETIIVTLYNTRWEKIILQRIDNKGTGRYQKEIDVSMLPAGLYYMKISLREKEQVEKIVVY